MRLPPEVHDLVAAFIPQQTRQNVSFDETRAAVCRLFAIDLTVHTFQTMALMSSMM